MPDQQQLNMMMKAYGVDPSVSSGFTFGNIMAWIIFGIVGMYAFNYGRKEKAYKPLVIGLTLMIYPYFVHNTWVLYLVGIGLTALIFIWKD